MMRYAQILIMAVLCASSALDLAWTADSALKPEDVQSSRASYVTPEIAKSWMDQGQSITFLDVREADEFASGHLDSAINIAFDQVASLAKQLPHDQPIILYCIHSAHRAPEAAKTLRGLGFANVHVLEGGIVAWQAEGLTILASDSHATPTILPVSERCKGLPKPPG